jgi:hypothetical protein
MISTQGDHTKFSSDGQPRIDVVELWGTVFPFNPFPDKGFIHSWLYYGDAEVGAAFLEAQRWRNRVAHKATSLEISKVILNILRKKKELIDAEVQRRAYQGASNGSKERTSKRTNLLSL